MTAKEFASSVTAFEFGQMSYAAGKMSVKLSVKNGIRTLRAEGIMKFSDYGGRERELSEEEWNSFFENLFSECRVTELCRRYTDGTIYDGLSWHLSVKFADGKSKKSEGNGVFPECWDALLDLIDSTVFSD